MMEREVTADHEARADQQLYEGFKEIWESDVPMSAEMHAAIEFGMNHHKPPNVKFFFFVRKLVMVVTMSEYFVSF